MPGRNTLYLWYRLKWLGGSRLMVATLSYQSIGVIVKKQGTGDRGERN